MCFTKYTHVSYINTYAPVRKTGGFPPCYHPEARLDNHGMKMKQSNWQMVYTWLSRMDRSSRVQINTHLRHNRWVIIRKDFKVLGRCWETLRSPGSPSLRPRACALHCRTALTTASCVKDNSYFLYSWTLKILLNEKFSYLYIFSYCWLKKYRINCNLVMTK